MFCLFSDVDPGMEKLRPHSFGFNCVAIIGSTRLMGRNYNER
jgi:hypothetical protein